MPKVSVIIPNYNHGRFLERRLESVLEQTLSDFELIFLDDGSTDNSLDVFARFSDDPRVRSFFNEENSGSAFKQWNKGLKLADGEYVWIAESDDYADPTLLEKLVDRLEKNPGAGLAYCQSRKVYELGFVGGSMVELTDPLDTERWKTDFSNSGIEEVRRYLICKNTIPNASAVVFRRDVCVKAGHADDRWRLGGDWMMWVNMLLTSDVEYVAEPLNFFRQHSGTLRETSYAEGLVENYEIIEFIIRKTNPPIESIERACRIQMRLWVDHMFSRQGLLPLSANIEVFKIASRVDQHLNRRLLKTFVHRQVYLRAKELANRVDKFINGPKELREAVGIN